MYQMFFINRIPINRYWIRIRPNRSCIGKQSTCNGSPPRQRARGVAPPRAWPTGRSSPPPHPLAHPLPPAHSNLTNHRPHSEMLFLSPDFLGNFGNSALSIHWDRRRNPGLFSPLKHFWVNWHRIRRQTPSYLCIHIIGTQDLYKPPQM